MFNGYVQLPQNLVDSLIKKLTGAVENEVHISGIYKETERILESNKPILLVGKAVIAEQTYYFTGNCSAIHDKTNNVINMDVRTSYGNVHAIINITGNDVVTFE